MKIKQLGLLLKWKLIQLKTLFPIILTVQIIVAVALVYGFKFLIGETDNITAIYLISGAFCVQVLSAGFVVLPQQIAESKSNGSYQWMQTLPISPFIRLLGELLIWVFSSIPAAFLGILVGSSYFNVNISIGLTLFLSTIVICLISACIGFAISCLFSEKVTLIITQVLIFFIMLFSPLSIPIARFPQWLQNLHQFLPISGMSELVRHLLDPIHFSLSPLFWLPLVIWLCLSLFLSLWSITRRK